MTPLAAGAVVMGTGIVSVALHLAHSPAVSELLLIVAAAAWILVLLLVASFVLRAPRKARPALGQPASLTLVAGTAVLGSRLLLAGLRGEAVALLIAAALMWPLLSLAVLEARPLTRTGSSFLLTVAIQSLAVLAALEGAAGRHAWLGWVSLALAALGLASYLPLLARFDRRELAAGAGDQWVAGGALAISALALAQASAAAKLEPSLRGAVPALHTISVVVWALSILWLAVLLVAELRFPRPGYEIQRWSTVFPVGMYAACSFAVARTAGIPAIDSFAAVWTWVAVAVWLVVAAGMAASLIPRGLRARGSEGYR